MPTNSENSFSSSRGSPDGGTLMDVFGVMENHLEHFRSASIVEVSGGKIFCSICLEARSDQDVSKFEDEQYMNYVKNIFNALDMYGETENIRKILLTLLSVILPKRPVDPQRDDRFHKILRIFNKVMNSRLFDPDEFVMLVKILSNISIQSMQPIPLKSVWHIWKKLLDYSTTISVESLLGSEDKVTEKMSNFVRSQAVIIRTYSGLLIEVSSEKYSHHIFSILHKHEPDILQKDHEFSQIECLRFAEEFLCKDLTYLLRSESFSTLDHRTILELFGAIHNCFKLSERRTNTEFVNWFRTWDPICRVHSIFYKDPTFVREGSLSKFLYAFVKSEIESQYGLEDLAWSFTDVNSVETRAHKVETVADKEAFCKTVIFYMLLNRVALRTRSTYYKRKRVKAIISINSEYMSAVRDKISSSKLLMKVHAFMMAQVHTETIGHLPSKKFIRNSWQTLYEQKNHCEFREIYCQELDVFKWAHTQPDFSRLIDFETIDYLTQKSLEQGLLNETLIRFINRPLRAIFAAYLKDNSKCLFERMITFGIAKIEKPVMNEFAGWLPSLLQEMMLAYLNSNDTDAMKTHRCERIGSIIGNINLLLSKSDEFNPHFDKYFVLDFVKLLEQLYRSELNDGERRVLIEAHELMALLLDSCNLCVMHLIQYMEFTLLGYMHSTLDSSDSKDQITEAIARVLIAYDDLDYPLKHRLDESLFSMPESACQWMLSQNSDLNRLALIVIFKLFSNDQYPSLVINLASLSPKDKLCLATAFLQMLLNNPEVIKLDEIKFVEILKKEVFQFHPYYKYLFQELPQLEDLINPRTENRLDQFAPTPDLTFDCDSSDDDLFGISDLLARLEGDEDVDLGSRVPSNIFLSGILGKNSQKTEFPGVDVWERRAHEATQSSFGTTQRTTQGSR